MQPGVFIDRDGVINHNPPSYVKSWEEFLFLPNVLEALSLLAQTPWLIVIITNQSVVGRGIIGRDTLDFIHRQMSGEVIRSGGRLDGIFVCPHAPEEGCDCRKPQPGLLLRAADELKIDLSKSIFIGDSESDIIAARSAGIFPVLVKGFQTSTGDEYKAHFIESGKIPQVDDLYAAVKSLLLVAERGGSPVDMIYYLPENPTKENPGEKPK